MDIQFKQREPTQPFVGNLNSKKGGVFCATLRYFFSVTGYGAW